MRQSQVSRYFHCYKRWGVVSANHFVISFFFCVWQVFISIVVWSMLSLWIFAANTAFLYCNICAHRNALSSRFPPAKLLIPTPITTTALKRFYWVKGFTVFYFARKKAMCAHCLVPIIFWRIRTLTIYLFYCLNMFTRLVVNQNQKAGIGPKSSPIRQEKGPYTWIYRPFR